MKMMRGALVLIVAMFVSIAGASAVGATGAGDTEGAATGTASVKKAAQARAIIVPDNFFIANALPFGSYGDGLYQQVYSSSLFVGRIKITSVSFFIGEYLVPPNAGFVLGTYTMSLSTTSVAVGSLDPYNMDANLGADNKTVFSGTLNGEIAINVKPFVYDPSQGNLLLTIEVKNRLGEFPPSSGIFWRAAVDTGTSRAINFPDVTNVGGDNLGLVTLFTFVPVP
jgi:hypothetical protein